MRDTAINLRLSTAEHKLRKIDGKVVKKLLSGGASSSVLMTWYDFVNEKLDSDSDDY